MNLRTIAERDLGIIQENKLNGFGWDINVTDPAGTTADLVGLSNDISMMIDPDTGQAVSGRMASVSIRIALLTANGLGLPVGVSELASLPWLVKFDDINGNPYTFKVAESNPDRTIGTVVCLLELYEETP